MPANAALPSSRGLLLRNMLLTLLLWTGGVVGSWWWSYTTHQRQIVERAKIEANTNINKDWSFRLWATSHGGVYVPPDEKTPPNPYLGHVPDRDIVTEKGKRLTLMNPAYMLRQIMQQYTDLYGVKGHITSLVLTNPNNVADAWETEALQSFNRGSTEAVAVANIDGRPYLRLMRPIKMEKGCMKCHGDIGIMIGEIRGGISTAVPMEPLYAASLPEIRNTNLLHGAVWLLGVVAIGFVAWRTKRESEAIDHYQAEIRELNNDLEQRVARRTAQLAAANKDMESFSYSVSHDLRTPLRAIDGYSRVLVEDFVDQLDDEGRRLLDMIRSNTKRMGQLIDDILSFSRAGRQELRIEEIDMAALAASVFAEIKAVMPGRAVELKLQTIPAGYGDPAMIRQVMANLLSNAMKFTSRTEAATIEVGGQLGDTENTYYVKDNGVGFDMQYAGKLFDMFQRLHGTGEFEGSGLGLAIVKRIVDKHGGRVWAEGKLNEGATFYFTLPSGMA